MSTKQATNQATQEQKYTDIRCDNVVWDKWRRENIRCGGLLLRLRPGDTLNVPVEACCHRCNRKAWVGGSVGKAA